MKSYWTIFSSITTLWALCLNAWLLYIFVLAPNSLAYKEFMGQEDVNGETISELRIRLFEAKSGLENARKEVGQLKIELKKSQSLLKEHQLKIAEIVSGERSGVKINETLLKELVNLRKELGMSLIQFDELSSFVNDSYKLLKANQVLKETFKVKATLLRDRVVSLLTVAGLKESNKGLVLDTNSELDVVAINLGYSAAVTQGSKWRVEEDGVNVASLIIVEVRKSLSLGILTEGKLQDVLPGATVEKIK